MIETIKLPVPDTAEWVIGYNEGEQPRLARAESAAIVDPDTYGDGSTHWNYLLLADEYRDGVEVVPGEVCRSMWETGFRNYLDVDQDYGYYCDNITFVYDDEWE